MGKINFNRVILGGLLAGVVWIVVEIVVEGLVSLFGFNEKDLLLQATRNVTLSGARYHIVNFCHLFVFCISFSPLGGENADWISQGRHDNNSIGF